MRIDRGAVGLLSLPRRPDDPYADVESGVIVPLVVGARIVGTLACWSDEVAAFHEQDERLLEMLASQVATAILAAETQEALERRALSDPLTNLPNRRQLSQDSTEFSEWYRSGRRAVVAMVDLDHFKQINDVYGHKVGDEALLKVATVMRETVREVDRIYRYGGEEFVIVMPDVNDEEAMLLTDGLLKAVHETEIVDDDAGDIGPITVSAGLALMPDHGEDVADLIVFADRAMYQAKQEGRNRAVIWDEDAPRTVIPAA